MKLASVIAVLALALAAAGCGSDSGSSTGTAAGEAGSEVAEVVAIKERGDEIHAEFVVARKLARTCLRLMKTAGSTAEGAWFEAVEEEAAELTPEERRVMADYKGAAQCVRGANAKIRQTGRQIGRLTKRLETFSPAAIEEAGESFSR